MKVLVFVCVISICLSCVAGLSLKGNVSFEVDNDDWSYRQTKMGILDFLNAGFFSSFSVGGTKNNIVGDALWGAIYCPLETYPTAWMAYYSKNVSFSLNDKYLESNVAESAGFIAQSFYQIREKDTTGKVVATLDLAQSVIFPSPNWDITDSNDDGLLKWITFTGTQLLKAYTLKLTFIVSDVIGVTDYGGATVAPKSLESIIEIKNWPYANPANTLSLIVATATGAATASGNGVFSGKGADKVYTSFSKQAIINSTPQSVTVTWSDAADAAAYVGDGVVAQLNEKYAGTATVKLAEIKFTAGAANIVYDPTMGAGDPAEPQASAASAVVAGLLSVFVVVMALL